ncbi:hypothetical protein K491DRAFT_276193 [Lophiostoma macrostomum CBS 122681]|uniref:Uncharacterized protein n=1 Tax=Lophiostoma macrostomum CBS 122681 TaxID=1314788 RepID=A0A6A6TGF5_9PLEO|nr:hypothetical protein K491DRAFT_276193 [Lophiostoma macrostomum CBS 122681]
MRLSASHAQLRSTGSTTTPWLFVCSPKFVGSSRRRFIKHCLGSAESAHSPLPVFSLQQPPATATSSCKLLRVVWFMSSRGTAVYHATRPFGMEYGYYSLSGGPTACAFVAQERPVEHCPPRHLRICDSALVSTNNEYRSNMALNNIQLRSFYFNICESQLHDEGESTHSMLERQAWLGGGNSSAQENTVESRALQSSRQTHGRRIRNLRSI